jgi:hypothetical protein
MDDGKRCIASQFYPEDFSWVLKGSDMSGTLPAHWQASTQEGRLSGGELRMGNLSMRIDGGQQYTARISHPLGMAEAAHQ